MRISGLGKNWRPRTLRRLSLAAIASLACHGAFGADLNALRPSLVAEPVAQQPPPVWPETGRITIIEENDALAPSPTDRWYTQGFELNYLSAPAANQSLDWLFPGNYFGNRGGVRSTRFEIVFGQSIFTPEQTHIVPPNPADRPYAGWLHGGFGLYQESGQYSLDHLRFEVGVVGPASLAKEVQNGFHSALGQRGADGWAFQLKNEPGVMLSYDHRWRFAMPVGGGLSVDAIPEYGVTAGNVYTYGEAGLMVRIGQNLKADYGPARIQPALSGTTWFDPSQLQGSLGWYLFVGAQGRGVVRDIFLDGNTFESSPSVKKRPFVGDVSAGASIFWLDIAKLDFVFTMRSEEFAGQSQPSRFGGINLSFRLP
jgi:hypothetical protein